MANNKADYTKLSDNFKSYLDNLNKKEEEKKLSSSSENAPKIPDGVSANFRKYLEDMQSGKTAQAETPKITGIERQDLITGKKMPSTFDVAKNAGRIPAISDENAMWNKFAAPKLEENAKKDAQTYLKTGSVTKRSGTPEEYPLMVEQNVKKLAARDFVNAVQNAKDSQKPANISREAAKYNEKNAAKNAAEQVIYERKMDNAAAIENAARLENEAAQKLQESDKKISDINNELNALYAQRERYNERLKNPDPNNSAEPYNPALTEERIAQTEKELEQAQAVKKYWENTSKRRENAFRISYDASVRNAKNNPDKTGYTPTKSGKEIVDLVNGNKKAGTYFGTYAPQEGEFELLRDMGFGKNSSYNNYDYVPQMNSDEVKAYNYVYNTEGADKANAYLEAIKPILTARYRKSVQEDMSEFATEHPAGASAVSLATNFIGGIDSTRATLGYLFNKATGKYVPLDQNDPKYAMSYATSDIRGTVADNMAQKGSFGEVGSFLYQTGMSMLDNVINTALTGGYGEALAGQSTSLTKNLSLALMGSQAAANGLISAKDRGLSDDQAFALGTISGAAEIITEKIPLDKLLDKLPAGKTAVAKYIGENILSEGLEEASSDVINFVADIAISKDKSEWNTAVNKYMTDDKLTKSEAVKKAFLDQVTEIGLDALGGAISGGTMSGFMSLANRIANRNYYTHLKIGEKDAAVNSALYVDYGSENGISLDNATKFTLDVADALGIKNPEKAFRTAVDYTREEIISLTKDSELVKNDTLMDGNAKTDIGINLDSETDYVKSVNDFIRNNQNDIKKRLSEIYAERNPKKAAKTAAETETTQNTAETPNAENNNVNNSALTENVDGATINAENTQSNETKTAPANKSLAYTALSNKLGITNDVTTEKMTDAVFERFGDVRSAVDFVFDTFKELDRNGDLDGESRKFFADLDKNIRNTAERVNQAQMNSLKRAAQTFGANVAWDNADNLSILAKDEESGGRRYSFARFDKSTNTIYLSPYASRQAVIGGKFIHEFTHFAGKYDGSVVSDILSAMNRATEAGKVNADVVNKINSFVSGNYQSEISAYLNSEEGKARISEITSEQNTDERTAADIAAKEYADEERAAYFMETLMQDDSVLRYLADDKKGRNILINIFEKIKSFIKKLLNLGKRDEAVAYAEAGNKIRAILNEKLDAELKMKKTASNSAAEQNAGSERMSKQLDADTSPITQADIEQLRSIGRKSISEFTSEDIRKSEKWAKKFYSELGTKSPFFRAWFGDWRENDTGRTNIVSVPTIDIKDAVLEYGDYHIKDTDWNVYAGRTLKDDTIHHSGGERINVKSLNSIESILENAVLLDTVVSENNTNKKAKYTAFLHKLYTPITYNSKEYLAVATVEEYYDESKNGVSRRAYNLKNIKIESADGRLEKISTSPMSGTDSTISISDLYALVKRYDKYFKSQPSSKVVNADGTPKIVYHGTTAKFNTFERGDIGFHIGTLEQAENRIDGSKDGRIMELYADIKNPLYAAFDFGDWHGKNTAGMLIETEQFEDFDNRESIENRLQEISNMSDSSEADNALRSFLKELGYDGIVYENGFEASGESYIAFDPTQIKSVDNLGTFDKSNGDIRFSKELDVDGKEFVRVDDETLNEKNPKDIVKALKQIAESKGFYNMEINGQNIGLSNKRGINEWVLSKSAVSLYKNNPQAFNDKMQSFQNSDELIETAKSFINEEAVHKKKFDNFARGVVRFKVGDNGYLADILIGIRKNQNAELYDIVNLVPIKIAEVHNDSVAAKTAQIRNESSADNRISQNGENVNTFDENNSDNFSKDFMTEEQRRELKDADRRKYLERQLVQTDPLGRNARAVAPTVVSRIAKDIAENMPGVTTSQVYEKLKGVFDVIEHPKSATVSEFNEEIRSAAEKAATELYNSWKVDNTNPLYDEYSGIYKEIATTPIFVSDEVKKDFDNYGDFYRENFGKLKFRSDKNSAQGVDSVYARLYGQSAVLFGDDNGEMIDNPADRLRKIAEVRNSLAKTPGHPASNPNSMIDTKTESGIISDLTNTILASYIDNSKLTVAARNKALETKNKALEKQVGEAKAKELEAAKTLNYLKRWQDAELNKTRIDFERNIKAVERELSRSERKIERINDSLAKQSRTKLRYTTLQKINRLLNLATNPTKTKYMPESYRKTVFDFLETIGDVELPNGKNISTAERAKLENIINKANALQNELNKTENNQPIPNRSAILVDNLDIIKSVISDLAEEQNKIEKDVRKTRDNIIRSETAVNINKTQYDGYLEAVNRVASALIHDINYQNKLFIGEKIESAEETQRKLIDDLSLKSSKFVPTGTKESFVKLREALNYYKYNFCSPSVFFSLIGDSGTEIEKAYREAQTKQTDKLKTYSDFMKEAVKDYDINSGAADNKKNVIGIELQGKKFDVTRNQLMSLYLLWNRPQGRQHLETGGAAFVNRKGKNNIVQTLKLDEQTFDSLMKHLSKKDIEVAKKVGDFLNSEVSEWGNEASMKLYGVRLFNEENYFPISSTNDSLTTNFTNVDNYRTIQNLGITKAVNPNAKNAIKIMDMFDVADTHIQQMSAYSSYAPLNDSMERLINMPNTKAAIENYMGEEGEKYLYNFLKTVNLNGARDGKWDPVIDKFSGAYKKAAVSFNLSTAAKQPLSIFRAAIIIDPKYLVKAKANLIGAGSNYKNSLAEMLNNSGIAKIKEQGYSDIGNPMRLRDTYFDETLKNTNTKKVKYGIDKINEIGMKLAGKADQVTWVRIWEACKLQVQAEAKNTLTQSELLKKTSELFGEVIGKTQVVDSFLDSAPISNSAVFRLVAPFMNEPLKTTSTYILAHENLIDAKGSGDKAAISKAKNYALRTAAAAVASNLILEPLISSVFSIIRDGEDDDLKSFFDKLLENYFGIQTTTDENGNETMSVTAKSILTSNFVDGMTSIPIISQIFDTFQNEAQNFDTTIGPIDLLKDTYKSTTNFFEALSNPDSYNQTKTDFALGLDFAANVARLFGIPATSWNRDIRLILQNGARVIPSDLARWNFNKVYYNAANSNARANKNFYDILESAYSKGDKASYYAMLKELKTIQTGEKSYGVKWNVMQNQIEKRGGKIEVGSPMWCVSVQAEFNLPSFNMKMKTESILANVYKDLESAGYDKTECEKVIYKSPTSAPTVTIDGEEKTMTASQYAVYIERVGYAAYDLIQALASTSYWNNLNADQQQYAIEKAYSYVKEYFKKQTFEDYEISTKWMSELAAKRAGDQSIAKEIVSRAKTYKKQNSKITH
mgnify:CR=1 FL=1